MSSLYCMLRKIQERPGLFLGAKSLEILAQFIAGYEFREGVESWEKSTGLNFFKHYDEAIRSIVPGSNDFNWLDFNKYVHSHYGKHMTTKSATRIISENSVSEADAFDKFYQLLDMYIKQKNSSLP